MSIKYIGGFSMRKFTVVSVFALLALLSLSVWPGVALAQEPPPDEPSPDYGDLPLGPPPGYRIDEPSPGAVVHREVIHPLGVPLDSGMNLMTLYRSGWTDGWFNWFWPSWWDHVGSHTSDSDLQEDQIWVDGFQKRPAMSGWWATCSDHRSGETTAHCNSVKRMHIPYTFYAESHHTFKKAGYADSYFETGKTIS